MGDDRNMKQDDAELEEYGVWIKAGQEGEEMSDWDLDDSGIEEGSDAAETVSGNDSDYYLTDEEEQILSNLEEEALPDFGDLETRFTDESSEQSPSFQNPEGQTPQPNGGSTVILRKIEGELELLRQEIRDLRKELVYYKQPDAAAVERIGDDSAPGITETAAGGFFDQDSGDETIALTGDELDTILNEEEGGYPRGDASLQDDEVNSLIDDATPASSSAVEVMALPEDEFQDGDELIKDTSLDTDFSLDSLDPGITMLSGDSADDSEPSLADFDDETLELHITGEDEGSDSIVDLDVSSEGNLVESDLSVDDEILTIDDFPTEDNDLTTPADEESEMPRIVGEVVAASPRDEEEEIGMELDLDIPDEAETIGEITLDNLDLEDTEPAFVLPDDYSASETTAEEEISSGDDIGEEISFEDFVTEEEPEQESTGSTGPEDSTEESLSDDFTEVNLDDIIGDTDSGSVESNDTGAIPSVSSEDDMKDDTTELPYDEGEEVDFDMEEDDSSLEMEVEHPSDGSEDVDLSDFGLDSDDAKEEASEEIDLSEFGVEEVSEQDLVVETEENQESEKPASVEPVSNTIDLDLNEDDDMALNLEDDDLADGVDLDDGEISLDIDDMGEESTDPLAGIDIEEEEIDMTLDVPEDSMPEIEIEESASVEPGIELVEEDEPEPDMTFDLEDEEINLSDIAESDEPEETIASLELEDEEIVLEDIEEIPVEETPVDQDAINEIDISALDDTEEPAALDLGEETLADLDDKFEDEAVSEQFDLHMDEEELSSPDDVSKEDHALSELPYDIRKELKEVLIYMDQLLEALPENKIKEFARSEHFEVYKKIFEELGIEK
jgi:hypothetical protein